MQRKIEVKRDGEWVGTEFSLLKVGETFRAFDANENGNYVPVSQDGKTEFTVEEKPTLCKAPYNEIWGVTIK